MPGKTRAARLGSAVALAVACLWLISPILLTGSWYHSHDDIRYPYLIQAFKDAFLDGMLYPRWIPSLMGGYGYPTFVYYQPGYFFFTLPFSLLFSSPLYAAYASLWAIMMIGGAGAYKLARFWRFTRPVSMALGMVFLLSPYLAHNLFVRGALAEAYAMLLLPWNLYFALSLLESHLPERKTARAWAGFTASLAAILLFHPHVFLFWAPFIAVLGLAALTAKPVLGRVLLLGAGGIASLALTSVYWLPALQMKHLVVYERAIRGGYDVLRSLGPFDAGISVWQLLPWLGFLLAWRYYVAWASAVWWAFLIFLCSFDSAPLWKSLPFMEYVQFSWRVKSVLATLSYSGVLLLLMQLRGMQTQTLRRGALALAVAGVVASAEQGMRDFRLLLPVQAAAVEAGTPLAWLHGKKIAQPLHRSVYERRLARAKVRIRRGFYTANSVNEFQPAWVRPQLLQSRTVHTLPLVQVPERYREAVSVTESGSPHRITFTVKVREEAVLPARVIINQLYFPGWRIEDAEGRGIAALSEFSPAAVAWSKDRAGRMVMHFFAPGEYVVYAWYDGPPRYNDGWLFAGVGSLLLGAGWRASARKRRGAFVQGIDGCVDSRDADKQVQQTA